MGKQLEEIVKKKKERTWGKRKGRRRGGSFEVENQSIKASLCLLLGS